RLTHAGTCRDDRELSVVETARQPVVPVEAGRDPGHPSAALGRLHHAPEGLLHDVAERKEARRFARSRDVVDRLFGRIDELLRLAVAGVALSTHALAGEDELPHAVLLVDG